MFLNHETWGTLPSVKLPSPSFTFMMEVAVWTLHE
jgi:hypothetical protein